jgi:hypothetical protein
MTVNSLFLVDDHLYSGSGEGSVKMWTIQRGVELKSFQPFDDGVSSITKVGETFIVSMSNIIVHYSSLNLQNLKLLKLQHFILDTLYIDDSVLTVSKNISSLSVQYFSYHDLVSQSKEEISLEHSCSAFFGSLYNPSLYFGLRDGSIISYDKTSTTRNFVTTVSSFRCFIS